MEITSDDGDDDGEYGDGGDGGDDGDDGDDAAGEGLQVRPMNAMRGQLLNPTLLPPPGSRTTCVPAQRE